MWANSQWNRGGVAISLGTFSGSEASASEKPRVYRYSNHRTPRNMWRISKYQLVYEAYQCIAVQIIVYLMHWNALQAQRSSFACPHGWWKHRFRRRGLAKTMASTLLVLDCWRSFAILEICYNLSARWHTLLYSALPRSWKCSGGAL